jgi:hypothetical protein
LSALASQASFTFSAPKSTTHEIAIVRVGGGLMGQNLSEAALKRYRQLLDANEQALVHSVFRKLEIPNDMWGDAVEPRGVLVMGFDKPWSVTIGTVNNPDPLKVIFGDDHKGTVVMTVDVRLLTDIKKHESEIVQLEVEVGVAGMYECFKQIGGKGRLVLAPGAEHHRHYRRGPQVALHHQLLRREPDRAPQHQRVPAAGQGPPPRDAHQGGAVRR